MPERNSKSYMNVEKIIHMAVTAQRIAGERQPADAFKSTERRLYAYPMLMRKVAEDYKRLTDIQSHGAPEKSKDIRRHLRSGIRLDADDVAKLLIYDIEAGIAAGEQEIALIDTAMAAISDDPYFDIVPLKYFEGKTDDEIAEAVCCDPRTVRRNKNKLIYRIAVFMYGAMEV